MILLSKNVDSIYFLKNDQLWKEFLLEKIFRNELKVRESWDWHIFRSFRLSKEKFVNIPVLSNDTNINKDQEFDVKFT